MYQKTYERTEVEVIDEVSTFLNVIFKYQDIQRKKLRYWKEQMPPSKKRTKIAVNSANFPTFAMG